ncbi:hypothetical protein FQR65_LT14577 [Abscondita terminalis]|nr:hypothetical protein FQR65_LT14577 [Abscondita terminalis]
MDESHQPGPSKKRKMKTTPEQYKLYLEMLESNIHFRENKVTPDNPTTVSDCWEKLKNNLNCSGSPHRSVPEWKRVFTDWKSQTRKRARIGRNAMKETGNVGEPETELSELEKKLLHLTGNIVVEGIKGVPELGIDNIKNIEDALIEERNIPKIERQKKQPINNVDNNVLKEIQKNLQELVELKKKEIQLRTLKMQLKYNIDIVDEHENSEK